MTEQLNVPSNQEHNFTNRIVKIFLESNLSIILILLAAVVGLAALGLTPREEDPQIIVPLADVYVSFPGHSAAEVEQLVTTPLEKILYQIDGVEYVYSMSREDQAIITVRFYVGEDRERSLVKISKKLDENLDIVPPGVAGWVVKPVEIDDVPVVTLTLTSNSSDDMTLRRVAEELTERLAGVQDVSRAYVVGGRPRVVQVLMDTDRMAAYSVSPLEIQRAIQGANVRQTSGEIRKQRSADSRRNRRAFQLRSGNRRSGGRRVQQSSRVFEGRGDRRGRPGGSGQLRSPRLGSGAGIHRARVLSRNHSRVGKRKDESCSRERPDGSFAQIGISTSSNPAVTIAIAKKKGSNAVWVANAVLHEAEELRKTIVPDNMELVVTRNYGLTANEKVNELVEGLAVAVLIVVALLTLGLGWREALIVAVAVPVVFGLTLAVNLMLGFTINRVTLFALILSLGLLVDDPIVDVENIARHFSLRKKATRRIVLEAVSEIRPPLITATLAVIVSFLPMFFITGMMGPYMRPMALNVPVTMLMSMLVAFTITPWMAFHILKRKYSGGGRQQVPTAGHAEHDPHDLDAIKQSRLYKFFYPLMAPLLHSRLLAWSFLLGMAVLDPGSRGFGRHAQRSAENAPLRQ